MCKTERCCICDITPDVKYEGFNGMDVDVHMLKTKVFGKESHICETCYRLLNTFGTSVTVSLPLRYKNMKTRDIVRSLKENIKEQGKIRKYIRDMVSKFYCLLPTIIKVHTNEEEYPQIFTNALTQFLGEGYEVKVEPIFVNEGYKIEVNHPRAVVLMNTWFTLEDYKEER